MSSRFVCQTKGNIRQLGRSVVGAFFCSVVRRGTVLLGGYVSLRELKQILLLIKGGKQKKIGYEAPEFEY